MKTTLLKTAELKNFKGIAQGTFNFNCENTEIVADVMQGKSTIKDAYLWCLGMEIDNFYPLDKNNRIVDGLETRVELVVEVNGLEYVLSRSAKVKYKNKVFDGYKKDMFEFDQVPCNTTEYKTKLCELLGVADFDTLKYLTILNYFNEEVNWKDRRALIYNLFADKTAIDSLKDNPKYDLIANELRKGKTSADISTMLNSETNRLNENKRRNEILLADKQAELAGFANIDYTSIETELASVETEITAEQARIDGLDKESTKAEIQAKIKVLYANLQTANAEDFEKSNHIASQIHCAEREIERLKEKGKKLEKDIEWYGDTYKSEKAKVFDEREGYCPHCHRLYETDKIEQIKKNWETKHEENLTALKRKVLSIKKEYEWDKEYYTNKLAELETAKQELADFKPNPRIAKLETEIATLQVELDKTETNEIDTSHLDELKDKRNFLIVELGKKDAYEKLKAKIESLIVEQRELANVEIVLLKKRQQLEEYTLDIIDLVNDSINAHFDGVKFKLFEELTATASKNIRECCTITHNGIEYQSCSTGEKAEVNLEIVTTLQKALGLQMNIFIDDGSITNIKKTVSNQLVWLMNEKGRELNCVKIKDLY